MTKAALDYETKRTHTVVVTVEDSSNESNDSDSITVTIEVKDLDEKPVIQKGGLNISGMASVEYAEGRMDAVDTYTAAGPMADTVTWTLEGDDAGDFSITGGMLSFRSTPDYEMPMDMDMDNMYRVTVKADDGTYMDMMDVTVMVTNMKETGTVTLSSMSPVVGTELTAMLDDPDKSVTMTGEGEGVAVVQVYGHGRGLHGHRRGNDDELHAGGRRRWLPPAGDGDVHRRLRRRHGDGDDGWYGNHGPGPTGHGKPVADAPGGWRRVDRHAG